MTPALFLSLALTTPAAPPDPAAPDVRATVEKGLAWLAKQQKPDGSWNDPVSAFPTVITSMAGLAFLMEGSTPAEGTYAPNIRKAVEWLEKNTRADGLIASHTRSEVYDYVASHTAAVLFLACAYDADSDPDRRARLKKLLEKAVAFLADCRSTRGGWTYLRSRDNGNTDSVYITANVLHALVTARKAGIEVPKELIDGAIEYLAKRPAQKAEEPYVTAAVAAAVGPLEGPRPVAFGGWVTRAAAARDQGDIRPERVSGVLIQYRVARLAFALGESGHRALAPEVGDAKLLTWAAYRAKLYPALRAAQQKDGNWLESSTGPAYVTAMALVILQLDNDYLPAFSR